MNSWNPYEVSYEKRALKEIVGLGRGDGERVRVSIERFAVTGRGDVKPIRGARHRYWELRVGLHLRVAFAIEGQQLKVLRVWRK
jgi:mRNA-degrading endonuclease RelE of RelBE toxin-antitoxin system